MGEPLAALYTRVYAINDGISAGWRKKHFGENYLTDPRCAGDADPDGDGADNFQEFTNQTDPLDKLSGFLVSIRAVPAIRWHSVAGKSYRILRRFQILGSSWEAFKTVTATADVTELLDPTVEGTEAYYIVELIP